MCDHNSVRHMFSTVRKSEKDASRRPNSHCVQHYFGYTCIRIRPGTSFSKTFRNSGNGAFSRQNSYRVNLGKCATTIRSGTKGNRPKTRRRPWLASAQPQASQRPRQVCSLDQTRRGRVVLNRQEIGKRCLPQAKLTLRTALFWLHVRSEFGPGRLSPKLSGIRETGLFQGKIHTGLIWENVRPQFGPAHNRPKTRRRPWLASAQPQASQRPRQVCSLDQTRRGRVVLNRQEIGKRCLPQAKLTLRTALFWLHVRSEFGPGRLSPKLSGIRETGLFQGKIHTGLIWENVRPQFGPAQSRCRHCHRRTA